MGWKFRQKNRFGSNRVPRESGVYEGLGKTRYSETILSGGEQIGQLRWNRINISAMNDYRYDPVMPGMGYNGYGMFDWDVS